MLGFYNLYKFLLFKTICRHPTADGEVPAQLLNLIMRIMNCPQTAEKL